MSLDCLKLVAIKLPPAVRRLNRLSPKRRTPSAGLALSRDFRNMLCHDLPAVIAFPQNDRVMLFAGL